MKAITHNNVTFNISADKSYQLDDTTKLDALVDYLKQEVCEITSLDLPWHNIEIYGAKDISEALKVNVTLTSLDVSYSIIGAAGAQHISEALKVNGTLTYLNLCGNSLRDAGAQHISEALKVNNTLAELELSNNMIGNACAKDISEALKVNNTLAVLDLRENNIGDAKLAAIENILETRRIRLAKIVEKLCTIAPFTQPLRIEHYSQLNALGKEYYDNVTDTTKITYRAFETKWKECFEIQYKNYVFNVAKNTVVKNDDGSQISIPTDIMNRISSFVTMGDKIDAMTKVYNERRLAEQQRLASRLASFKLAFSSSIYSKECAAVCAITFTAITVLSAALCTPALLGGIIAAEVMLIGLALAMPKILETGLMDSTLIARV